MLNGTVQYINMLSVIMRSVIMLNGTVLYINMLSVIMLNGTVLNVMGPRIVHG
jgi:hypothetical protein